MSDAVEWIRTVRPGLLRFVDALHVPDHPGFYRYSLSGDLKAPGPDWGLANAVFTTKTLFMLNSLSPSVSSSLADFIISFQTSDGYISDPYLLAKSRLRRLKTAIRTRNLESLRSEQMRRAETRQSFAALRCLGAKPVRPFLQIPRDPESVRRYLTTLDWSRPWSAGSHASHLLFFLKENEAASGAGGPHSEDLISQIMSFLQGLRQEDGSWHSRGASLPAYEKVNGAMKVLTGMAAAGREDWDRPEALVDLCLASLNDNHACNHFNITYVLHCATRRSAHRRAEVERYLIHRLELYRKHYWPEAGGFSFYEGRANDVLYNARVTRGLPEPDIHGTVLFVWGICLIADFLGMADELGLKAPIT